MPRIDVWHAPKGGHTAEEYEDAAATSPPGVWPVRAAVADGATESAFAGAWARRLAEGLVQRPPTAAGLRAALPAWQGAWQAQADRLARGQPWYAAAKAEEGAHATVLSLSLRADGTWQAVGVGDCCLFHLRGEREQLRWPIDAPEAFGNRPVLVSSLPGAAPADVCERRGRWQPGDVLLLATDAAAAWLMRAVPARALALAAGTFHDEVAAARDAGLLRNDDVTLVRILTPPPR